MQLRSIRNILLSTSAIFLIFLLFESCSATNTQYTGSSQNSYNIDDLNQYGEWINVTPYGDVWHPYAVTSWMPFDNGHWIYSYGNWTWVSYEPFGWLVYHYGCWYDDPFYGWVWVPTNDIWTPANVLWIDYDNYVGWAPLPPRGVSYGRPWEERQEHYWHVVRKDDFTRDDVNNYRITNPVRNVNGERNIYNDPPERRIIENAIGTKIPELKATHETIKFKDKEIRKMTLPKEEHNRIEQPSLRVKKEVLLPREEYKKQQSNRNEKR